MEENNSPTIENISTQLENIEKIYDAHNNEPNNDGHLINLLIAIFDYVEFHFVSESGFRIISMDIKNQQEQYLSASDANNELEQSRCRFRASLFLTINYHLFTLFIGMLHTAESIPDEDFNKQLQPDDPKRVILDRIVKLFEIKNNTSLKFPILYDEVAMYVPVIKCQLENLLNTFDDESAILYNQEKRRIFKTEIFGKLTLELPEDEELQEMKKKCNFVEPFKESLGSK